MFAHELVANARKIFNGSSSEKDVINEQWRDIRDSLIELLREEAQQRVLTTLEGISLYDRIQATNNESIQKQLQARLVELVDQDLQTNSTVMLSDVSGSMDCDNGIPMNASIALGIMNAEIMHELQPTFGESLYFL